MTGETDSLPETLEPIENVSILPGGDSVSITVNKSQDAYFSIDFRNIGSNDVISDGLKEGWCIDWQKPISSNNAEYNAILYSTYLVEGWERLNYLFNIKKELLNNDPELTWRELQLAIWALRSYPEFNLEEVVLEDLSDRFLIDGQQNFSFEKVRQILNKVDSEYGDFDFVPGSKFAIIVATPADVQTLITVVE